MQRKNFCVLLHVLGENRWACGDSKRQFIVFQALLWIACRQVMILIWLFRSCALRRCDRLEWPQLEILLIRLDWLPCRCAWAMGRSAWHRGADHRGLVVQRTAPSRIGQRMLFPGAPLMIDCAPLQNS